MVGSLAVVPEFRGGLPSWWSWREQGDVIFCINLGLCIYLKI